MKECAEDPPGDPSRPPAVISRNALPSPRHLMDDFLRAFVRASGLPIEITGKEGSGHRCCGEQWLDFCKIIHESGSPHIRETCGNFNRNLEERARNQPQEARCFAGIRVSSIPMAEGADKVGYLKTVAALPERSEEADFGGVMRVLTEAGLGSIAPKAKAAWLSMPAMDPVRYQTCVDLLGAFTAQVFGEGAGLDASSGNGDSPALREVQRYIEGNSEKRLRLADVARIAGMSPNYFCRRFHAFTGLSFTDYLAEIRVANAARLLADPNKRIKEIAYETGFNSISQFNRVFHGAMGKSPSEYRLSLPGNPTGD